MALINLNLKNLSTSLLQWYNKEKTDVFSFLVLMFKNMNMTGSVRIYQYPMH